MRQCSSCWWSGSVPALQVEGNPCCCLRLESELWGTLTKLRQLDDKGNHGRQHCPRDGCRTSDCDLDASVKAHGCITNSDDTSAEADCNTDSEGEAEASDSCAPSGDVRETSDKSTHMPAVAAAEAVVAGMHAIQDLKLLQQRLTSKATQATQAAQLEASTSYHQ